MGVLISRIEGMYLGRRSNYGCNRFHRCADGIAVETNFWVNFLELLSRNGALTFAQNIVAFLSMFRFQLSYKRLLRLFERKSLASSKNISSIKLK